MQEKLHELKRKRGTDEGFTLIELLVVVVIIGVLVAIAVPVYLNYTKGAKNKSIQSDIRAAISAVEQAYTEANNVYPTAVRSLDGDDSAGDALTAGTQRIILSQGNKLGFNPSGNSYTICATNIDTDVFYKYDSAAGGSVAVSQAATPSLTAC